MIYFRSKGKRFRLKVFGKVLLLLFGIILGLLLMETLVRAFVSIPLEKEYMRFCTLNYRKIPEGKIDKKIFWVNERALQGRVHSKKKPKNILRILCMGDSTTQGLNPEVSYPLFLEQKGNSFYKTKRFDVINAGCGGYSSLQVLRYLERDLISYDPDIVIAWFGIHDINGAWFYQDKEQRIPSLPKRRKFLEKSNLFRFLVNCPAIIKNMHDDPPRVSLADYRENCNRIKKLALDNNAWPVFIIPFTVDIRSNTVSYWGEYYELLRDLATASDCTVIDLVPFLRKSGKLSMLFADECHPTGAGNEMIASYILENLDEKIRIKGKM